MKKTTLQGQTALFKRTVKEAIKMSKPNSLGLEPGPLLPKPRHIQKAYISSGASFPHKMSVVTKRKLPDENVSVQHTSKAYNFPSFLEEGFVGNQIPASGNKTPKKEIEIDQNLIDPNSIITDDTAFNRDKPDPKNETDETLTSEDRKKIISELKIPKFKLSSYDLFKQPPEPIVATNNMIVPNGIFKEPRKCSLSNKKTGLIGECFAYNYFVEKYGKEKVIWHNEEAEEGNAHDFTLLIDNREIFVEVKSTQHSKVGSGIANISICQTNESKQKGDDYWLCLISNVQQSYKNGDTPIISIIENPSRALGYSIDDDEITVQSFKLKY